MTRITVVQKDITELEVDAIVNAANADLRGGGGVDGAIHRAGGPAIMAACDVIRETQGGCPTGEAVITTGGRLKAKYVIHTVGPVWRNGLYCERELLSSAYRSSLQLARDHALNTVAFSNISTGVYGYPKKDAAEIAVATVRAFLEENTVPEEVIFCCFDDENYSLYQQLLL